MDEQSAVPMISPPTRISLCFFPVQEGQAMPWGYSCQTLTISKALHRLPQ